MSAVRDRKGPGGSLPIPAIDRFWPKLKVGRDGCWHWLGARNDQGYGTLRVEGRTMGAHRFAYEQFVGPIPDGMQLDHLCRVRHCVNPDHLEPVTGEENTRRGEAGVRNRSKTHCPQGHPYDANNTIVRTDGRRDCRTCRRASDRAYKERRRAERLRSAS